MEQNSSIALIVACDNHYMVLLAALLKSVELTHRNPETIEVFIVEDGVSGRNKKKLTSSLNPEKMQLHWLSMDEAIPENMKIPYDRSTYPKNIHTRMFIPYFIPKVFDKIIYLDVDMILTTDISELWRIDLGEYLLAAVKDSWVKTFGHPAGGVLNYKELGFPAETKYFNSGLLLINIKKWREERSPEKIVKCMSENEKYANFPDQYALNVVMADQWLELDPRWNTFASDPCDQPFLIHFTGRKPIYKTYMNQPKYRQIFYEYLNQTEWKEHKPIGETKRYIKKISNIVWKLPELLRRKGPAGL